MLHEYRKTATIKAEQYDGSEEMEEKYGLGLNRFYQMVLESKEGPFVIKTGDWIATGIDGEHWVIDDKIFHRTYERVD